MFQSRMYLLQSEKFEYSRVSNKSTADNKSTVTPKFGCGTILVPYICEVPQPQIWIRVHTYSPAVQTLILSTATRVVYS